MTGVQTCALPIYFFAKVCVIWGFVWCDVFHIKFFCDMRETVFFSRLILYRGTGWGEFPVLVSL